MKQKTSPKTPKHVATTAPTRARTKSAKTTVRGKVATLPSITPSPKAGSKTALLLELLHQTHGVSVAEAASALNWQPHSVRGMLAGTIKGKLGLPLEHVDDTKPLRYRLPA